MDGRKILIVGGGTGGHLFPGLALADALVRADPACVVAFVGTREGLDRQLIGPSPFPLHLLATGRGSPLNWRKPANAPRFAWSVVQAWRLFSRERPAAVVGLGGFAAAVPGWIAHRRGVPLALFEPNVVPGRVNRRLAPWAASIHLQFEETRPALRAGPSTAFHVDGVPLRGAVRALAERPSAPGDTLLVFGGSQGARRLNELVVGAAAAFHAATGAPIVHVAGAAHEDAVRMAYREKAPAARVEVVGFCDDMAARLAGARMLVGRSGAGTIADAAAAGAPALYVPLSTSADDHQRRNAEAAVRRGLAASFDETADAPGEFAPRLVALWKDEAARRAMAGAARAFARADAADRMAEKVLRLAAHPQGGA